MSLKIGANPLKLIMKKGWLCQKIQLSEGKFNEKLQIMVLGQCGEIWCGLELS